MVSLQLLFQMRKQGCSNIAMAAQLTSSSQHSLSGAEALSTALCHLPLKSVSGQLAQKPACGLGMEEGQLVT